MFVRYDPQTASTASPSLPLSSSLPRPIQPTMRSHRLARTSLFENGGEASLSSPSASAVNGESNSPSSSPDDELEKEVGFRRRRRRRPGNLSADDTCSLDRSESASLLKGTWFFERVQQEQAKDPQLQLQRTVSDSFLRNSVLKSNEQAPLTKKLQPFVINDSELDDDDYVLV